MYRRLAAGKTGRDGSKMAALVYFSQTGQTRRFVQKIQAVEKFEITVDSYEIDMKDFYILIMPSYEADVYPAVIDTAADFLERGNNLDYCRGLFGSGNRNFAELFGITARTLAEEYDLPLLHTFEFQGSPSDVKKMEEELSNID